MDAGITALLHRWRDGDVYAVDLLLPIVYDELRRMARRQMRGERKAHTLQPTGLVHEAYLKLVDAEVAWQDRMHFFAVAARAMRRVLVDHAKSRCRSKRGGGATRVTLDVVLAGPTPSPDIELLDAALDALAAQDPRKGQMLELQLFGGLTYGELAKTLGVSEATVHRELKVAKAWIVRRLTHASRDRAPRAGSRPA